MYNMVEVAVVDPSEWKENVFYVYDFLEDKSTDKTAHLLVDY